MFNFLYNSSGKAFATCFVRKTMIRPGSDENSKMDDRRNNNAVVQQLGMTHGTYFIQFVPLGSPLGSASELGSLGFCHFGPGQEG